MAATAPVAASGHVEDAERDRRQRWNRGKVGTSALPRTSPLTEPCHTEDCGTRSGPSQPDRDGWTRTSVSGSAEPPRWWCSARCAGRGIALAELRPAPGAPAGPDRPPTGCLDGCGSPAVDDRPRDTGWVLTSHVHQGRRVAVWWCAGTCAHAGVSTQAREAATRP